MIKNILITGSGGFVGKNLKEFLATEFNLFCPRSSELNLTDKDAVQNYFLKHDIDFIIHCATTGGVRGCQDPKNCEKDNLKMVCNLLQAKKESVLLLTFGSGAAYGKSRDLHKIKETQIGEFIPQDQYGKSKMKLAKLTQTRDDMICLNIFACYGKYEKDSRFPTYAITQNLKKQNITINKNVVFDYLYIDDLCRIVRSFISTPPQKRIINVTPAKSISLLEIAQTVNNIGLFKSKITFKEQGMNFEYTGDNSILLSELPDFEFTPFEKGAAELYAHISAALNPY